MSVDTLPPLPSYDDVQVVVPAPDSGPGNWAGAASAVLVDGTYWLTYRVRRPLTEGRGVAVVVARSADGVTFERVAEINREAFGCESFERPVLVPVPGVGWRLYLSCATYDSKHWWVDSLTAPTPEELPTGHPAGGAARRRRRRGQGPGRRPAAPTAGGCGCAATRSTDAGHEDRMTTRLLTSVDGLDWIDQGEVLAGRAGRWDARGARVTTEIGDGPLTVLYDGRADAASNWHETTGVARWDGIRLVADDEDPIASPHSDGAWRYASAVRLPDGRTRFYVEAARPDGAHDLVTLVR